jgi:hypothetical protein
LRKINGTFSWNCEYVWNFINQENLKDCLPTTAINGVFTCNSDTIVSNGVPNWKKN